MTGHVVLTGGSAGIGRAVALRFARDGWRVSLLARGRARLEEAAAAVIEAGGQGLGLPTDVADAAAVEAAAEASEREHGPIDVWINNAMATLFAPVAEVTADEYRRVTEVTYLGQVHGTMSALRRMRPRDRGTIVNVNSALGYHGLPLQAAYCGAKFAARGFTESLRGELLHDGSGVRLSLVVLPAVNTPQFDWARERLRHRPRPLPPVFQPEAVAAAIRRAAATAPRELVVGGTALKMVLGSLAAPGLLDRLLARQAYGGQQTTEAAERRADNLFHPVEGDAGAHGRFDAEARTGAAVVSLDTARGVAAGVGGALLAAAAIAGYAAGRRRRRRRAGLSLLRRR